MPRRQVAILRPIEAQGASFFREYSLARAGRRRSSRPTQEKEHQAMEQMPAELRADVPMTDASMRRRSLAIFPAHFAVSSNGLTVNRRP